MADLENVQYKRKNNIIEKVAFFMLIISTLEIFWERIIDVIIHVTTDIHFIFFGGIGFSPYFYIDWYTVMYNIYYYLVPLILVYLIFIEYRNIFSNRKKYFIIPVILGILITILNVFIEICRYDLIKKIITLNLSTWKVISLLGLFIFTISSMARLYRKLKNR